MKALSVRQPWAWAIAKGLKPLENRTWKTKYRGPVLIHAALTYDVQGSRWIRQNFPRIEMPHNIMHGLAGRVEPDTFYVGGIIGMAQIVDCVQEHDSPWFMGPNAFVLITPSFVPFLPCKGKLGFFTPEESNA